MADSSGAAVQVPCHQIRPDAGRCGCGQQAARAKGKTVAVVDLSAPAGQVLARPPCPLQNPKYPPGAPASPAHGPIADGPHCASRGPSCWGDRLKRSSAPLHDAPNAAFPPPGSSPVPSHVIFPAASFILSIRPIKNPPPDQLRPLSHRLFISSSPCSTEPPKSRVTIPPALSYSPHEPCRHRALLSPGRIIFSSATSSTPLARDSRTSQPSTAPFLNRARQRSNRNLNTGPGSDLQPRVGARGHVDLPAPLRAENQSPCERRPFWSQISACFSLFIEKEVSKGKFQQVFFSSAPHHFSLLVLLALFLSFITNHRPAPALPASISHEPSRHALARFSFFHSFSVPCSVVPRRRCSERQEGAWLAKGPIVCWTVCLVLGLTASISRPTVLTVISSDSLSRKEAFSVSTRHTKPHHVAVAIVGWRHGNRERA